MNWKYIIVVFILIPAIGGSLAYGAWNRPLVDFGFSDPPTTISFNPDNRESSITIKIRNRGGADSLLTIHLIGDNVVFVGANAHENQDFIYTRLPGNTEQYGTFSSSFRVEEGVDNFSIRVTVETRGEFSVSGIANLFAEITGYTPIAVTYSKSDGGRYIRSE